MSINKPIIRTPGVIAIHDPDKRLVDLETTNPTTAKIINAAISFGKQYTPDYYSLFSLITQNDYDLMNYKSTILYESPDYLDFLVNGHFGINVYNTTDSSLFHGEETEDNQTRIKRLIGTALEALTDNYIKTSMEIWSMSTATREKNFVRMTVAEIGVEVSSSEMTTVKDWLMNEKKAIKRYGEDAIKKIKGEELDPFRQEVFQTILFDSNNRMSKIRAGMYRKYIRDIDTDMSKYKEIYSTSRDLLHCLQKNEDAGEVLRKFEAFQKRMEKK